MTSKPKIEHSGNAVYAIHTPSGPAIFPTLDDLRKAQEAGEITPEDGDREYYDSREWLPVRD